MTARARTTNTAGSRPPEVAQHAQGARYALSRVVAPYRVDYEIWGIERCQIVLAPLTAHVAMNRYWPGGLSADIAGFIVSRCNCAHCGARFSLPLTPCRCEASRRARTIIAAYERLEYREEIRRIYAREERRAKKRGRAILEVLGGIRLSASEVRELLVAQHHMCFWCASSLLDGAGKARYHCDHYVPLSHGGANGLSNRVLACAACNLEKNDALPVTFERRMRKRRTKEAQAQLSAMRRSLAQWRRQRGGP